MLTIPTTPEIEARLQSAARERGLSVEAFALEKLLTDLPDKDAALSDAEFDAALDELQNSFPARPFDAAATRAHKETEMALEEAKHARLFGTSDETESARLAAIARAHGFAADVGFSTDDLHRERREDLARDEAKFQRQFGEAETL